MDNHNSDRDMMIDSYQIITGQKSFEELLEIKDDVAVLFHPYKPIKVMEGDAYDVLIDYFISTEEYEKCQELVNAKEVDKLIN
mgnify:CR=1 FL=1|tara:strand:+ start:4710 stop:4958 length:249 start_codon:yes stop_codon:yes gene_type:complete